MAKARREKIMLRVSKGSLVPADQFTAKRLRERGYKVGDLLAAELAKPRNPGFWRLAHQFGTLVAENIEDFEGIGSHAVLKRLQIEGKIGCDEIPLNFPGVGPVSYLVPRSLGYESMDQGEFHEVMVAFCRYISKRYWPGLSPEQIEQMAGVMVEAA